MRKHVVLLILLAVVVVGCSHDERLTTPRPPTPPVPPPGGDDLQQPGPTYWWNDQVFYEIFVRSFQDSDGDGIGDPQGLIQKLDYLNDGDPDTDTDLGVTALWLMPIAQSPSYHGYDTTDYRAIESDYGTTADFQQLMSEAHARGISVIVDYVMNHCSSQHPWFTASAANDPAYSNWFVWRPTNPGWQQPWGGGQVFHFDNTRNQYYYGVFWGGMPDLNYTNPDVEQEMFDTADFWLNTLGADGFRLDAVKYMIEEDSNLSDTAGTLDFWGRFRQHLNTVAPNAFTVGEAWDATEVSAQYVEAGLHTTFDFDLAGRMISGANSGQPGGVTTKMVEVVDAYPYHQYATFLTNHDHARTFTQLGSQVGRNRVAAATLLTLPGAPFIYYGEEVGMQGDGDDRNKRRPMQWTGGVNAGFTTGTPWYDVGGNYTTNNVATMAADNGSLWNHYRRLVQARAGSVALQRGTYHQFASSQAQLYAFLRHHGDQAVVAVHNFGSGDAEGWVLSAGASQLAPGTYTATDLVTGVALNVLIVGEGGVIANWKPADVLPGYGTLLIELTAR